MLSRRWLTAFILVGSLILALKLVFAYSTEGGEDTSLGEIFLAHIQECGVCVYKTRGLMVWHGLEVVNPFNHPPFIIHYLRFLDFLSQLLNLDFRFVFRSVTSLIDVGSALVVYRLLIRQGLYSPWRFLLYLLAPATIIISGYHGNTDTLMIFFVLLTALLIEKPAWSGLAFGMALNIKLVPIMFAVVFLAYIFYLSVQINHGQRPPLMVQLGGVVFLFMSFTSGWGANYMAWLDPFPIALGVLPALCYYGASGALLGYLYFVVHNEGTPLMRLCWIAVLIVTWLFMRQLGRKDGMKPVPKVNTIVSAS